jgi:DNA-binding beta-propeller fold protein YncE
MGARTLCPLLVLLLTQSAASPHNSSRRALQLGGHAPIFSKQHPDANPGARPNADINLGKKFLRGTGDPTAPKLPRAWYLEDGAQGRPAWPSQKPHAITGAGAGALMATEIYGQVTGVDVDSRGRVWVLQRTPERKWDGSAFSMQHKIRYQNPIRGNTIVRYASEDATEIDLAAGADVFQMPHMITVDGAGNVWVVDCGLHQVLKYAAGADGEVDFARPPALELGVKLQPGSDERHYCKPTDVAIKSDGSFFVSDGYCNSRIIYYNPSGKIVKQWGSFGKGRGQFNLPHALAWDEERAELFVADRSAPCPHPASTSSPAV